MILFRHQIRWPLRCRVPRTKPGLNPKDFLCRHVILPWPALEHMNLFDSVRGDKEAYLALERAGKHHVDLLPGMVFLRAPAEVECSAARRVKEATKLGKKMHIWV
jgi:hypothetical protein